MSKRNIEKHILMNKAEAQDLQKKAKRACLSEGGLIRLLLRGYEPREKPDERFYDVMRELFFGFDPINGLLIQSGFHCQCICAKSLFPAGGPNLFRARLYVHFVHLGYSPFVHFLLLYFPFRGMSSLFCCPYGDNVLL